MATSVTSTTTLSARKKPALSRGRKSGIGSLGTASTPNLNALYSAQSKILPSLPRKISLAALTPRSLAAIPDASESYAESVLNESVIPSPTKMAPLTPGKGAGGDDVFVGDVVDVPGSMYGTVRFVGSVEGRKGTFAGVELHSDFAARGKNSGDVDGVSYFTTSTPGAGIFVPVTKLFKRDSQDNYNSIPLTPTGNSMALKIASQNSTNYNAPAPSLPKFSQSVGPGRAPSPAGKRPRTSLPRPDSPVRRLQMTPGPRPSMAAPPSKVPPRYGSPAITKFGSSVYGVAGDPNKPPSRLDRKPSIVQRSASALGQISAAYDDEETNSISGRGKTNGSIGSMSSIRRPGSRAAHANDEEIDRLKSQLEDRDRQLKEQASALAEMESSLTELTTLIDQTDVGRRPSSLDDKDTQQLRAMLREKNDKIALLTTEFDAHRADFRSTIDTLEMASTETQRVYDAKIRELEQEIQEVQQNRPNDNLDVDGLAVQLKQLEELVQELEEGLEDARRGEAEARGEVEFLRGEVERTRSELRREREKASASIGGTGNAGDRSSISKELEQKEDEIRGLKAIIHSLSRDSVPGTDSPDKTPTQRHNSFPKSRPESIGERMAREKLEREVFELRGLIDSKNKREEELEQELEGFKRHSGTTNQRGSYATARGSNRSSLRDSKGTVILSREPRSPETHKRALDPMPESDSYSSVTDSSALWCEICETGGHDILTCTNMFGPQQEQNGTAEEEPAPVKTGKDAVREGLKNLAPLAAIEDAAPRPLSPVKPKPAVAAPPAPVAPPAPPAPPASNVKILPNPTDVGPLAGKESGTIDPEKWCALCERDGHDSIDCPLEDAF